MTVRERITRLFQAPPAAKPKTYPGKVLGSKVNYFGKRDPKQAEYRRIYEQGGPVSEAVDCYPLMMFTNGYRVEGKRAKDAEQLLDDLDFETISWKLIVDSLVVKVGYAEMQPGLDATKFPIAKLDHRYPETFEEVKDDYGTLLGYKQTIGADYVKRTVDVKPEAIFRLDLGLPLIERAYDDIMRDAVIATGTAKSIERHGFPRYHITMGEPGETVAQTDIDAVAKAFEGLKPQHEMATAANVKITNIDNQGVQNTKLYGDWATQRVTAALGVPEEFLGLGRGVLTGEVRVEGFYDKIGALQKRFARQWNAQVFDKWALATGGKSGAAKLVFNDVSPIDESKTAELIQKLTAYSLDPWQIVTPEWCRKRLGISEEEFQKWTDEQAKLDAEEAKLYPPPPSPFQPEQTPLGEQPPKEEVK
ncbi:MAG: hypothetical protein V2A71_02020 [Candidatus Eisenbacteria bacterium]